jgi:hypothetical protein
MIRTEHPGVPATERDALRPNIRRLLAYWQILGGGAAPDRASVEPAAIKDLLPYLMLVEFSEQPFRIRYRLTGTRVDEQTGLNLTGRYLDEFCHGEGRVAVEQLVEGYRRCAETGTPHHGVYEWPTRAGYLRRIGFGLFPLRVNGAVRQCLSIEDYSDLSPDTRLTNWVAPVLPRARPADPDRISPN